MHNVRRPEIFLSRRRHHCRWRAAEVGLCSAFVSYQQEEFLFCALGAVNHGHGFVHVVSSERLLLLVTLYDNKDKESLFLPVSHCEWLKWNTQLKQMLKKWQLHSLMCSFYFIYSGIRNGLHVRPPVPKRTACRE